VAKAFSNMFKVNHYLIHLDISFCNFKAKHAERLNEGLMKNHSILGIHMLGNEAEVDGHGFIRPKELNIPLCQIYTRLEPTLDHSIIKNQKLFELKATSNCWICEGWTEIKFEFTPGISSNIELEEDKPLMLHLESDEFEEDLMMPDRNKPGTYSSLRVVPPG